MGTEVTVIEMGEKLLPGEDEDITSILHEELKNQGVTVHTSTAVKNINATSKTVYLENGDGKLEEMHADYVLVSIGRRPRVNGVGLEENDIDFPDLASRWMIECKQAIQRFMPAVM